jgi:hypothetical protein
MPLDGSLLIVEGLSLAGTAAIIRLSSQCESQAAEAIINV